MSVSVVVVERRRDGRLFPEGGKRTPEDLRRAILVVHQLRCRERLSFRQVVDRLASEHGLRVSLGSAHYYWRGWECPACRGN